MEWQRDTPWRQGHLLDAQAIQALSLPGHDDPNTLAIVATHDCDIAQHPQTEPFVEIFMGKMVAKADGNCTHAKSARTLHIEFHGEPAIWGEFKATQRIQISKIDLVKSVPREGASLSVVGRSTFQSWLASRYRRSAFPDAFEKRLVEVRLDKKISSILKDLNKEIVGVFFDVDDGEEHTRVDADDVYVLDIMLMHAEEPDFAAAEALAEKAADAISNVFNEILFAPTQSWKLIELRSCNCASESVITYSQYKMMKRWRLDHVSLGAEPQIAPPAP